MYAQQPGGVHLKVFLSLDNDGYGGQLVGINSGLLTHTPTLAFINQ
jgi:hypothetical protein